MNIGGLSQRKWLAALALAVAVTAVYWEVKDHSFVNYDDDLYVTNNSHVQAGLHWKSLSWAFTTADTGNWFPLTWLSHMLDCQIYGVSPAGHHLTNLAFHLANVLLLFFLLRWMTGRLWRSALVAALFGLHPLNVESVAWVAERKNLLGALFYILTICAYAWYVARPGWKRYLGVVVAFLMALMSKPAAVTLPLVLLLLDFWPLGRLRIPHGSEPAPEVGREDRRSFAAAPLARVLVEKVPLLVLSAADSFITVVAQKRAGNMPSSDQFPIGVRIENALISYTEYLRKTVWPADMAVLYPYPKSHLPASVILAVFLLAGITFGVVWFARRIKYLGVGWFWFLGILIPVIGIVQVGHQSMADRYAYVPLVGIFILIVWGIADLVERKEAAGRVAMILGVCAFSGLTIVTRVQLSHWTDSVALFTHAINVTENNYVAYNNLGEALINQGRIEEAGVWFSKALDAYPELESAHLNQGMLLVQQGRLDEGIAQFSRAIQLNPGSYDAYNRLGGAFLRKGQLDRATSYLDKALEINPSYAPAMANLGIVQKEAGRTDDAIVWFEKGLPLASNPDMAVQFHYWLATLFFQKGQYDQAAQHYREILRLKPDFAPAVEALKDLAG